MAERIISRRVRLLPETPSGKVGEDGFTITKDNNVALAEYAQLSLQPGQRIEQLLSSTPLQYVNQLRKANGR